MKGLYAIADLGRLEVARVDPVAFVRAILRARPAAVQVRAKQASARYALSLLRELAPLCRELSVPLVANDRPDLAVLAGCRMVHVGQKDMPIERVRRLAPGIGVGISTHTVEQLDAALAFHPTYVAYGPVFETSSKDEPDPVVGLHGLAEAHRRAARAGIPLVAIGGITRERAQRLTEIADAIAVIGELMPSGPAGAEDFSTWLEEVTERARGLTERFLHRSQPEGFAQAAG